MSVSLKCIQILFALVKICQWIVVWWHTFKHKLISTHWTLFRKYKQQTAFTWSDRNNQSNAGPMRTLKLKDSHNSGSVLPESASVLSTLHFRERNVPVTDICQALNSQYEKTHLYAWAKLQLKWNKTGITLDIGSYSMCWNGFLQSNSLLTH